MQGTRKTLTFSTAIKKAERLRAGTKGPEYRKIKRADMKITEKTRLSYSAFPVQAGQRRTLAQSAISLYTVYKNRASVKGFSFPAKQEKKAARQENRPAPAKTENRGILIITIYFTDRGYWHEGQRLDGALQRAKPAKQHYRRMKNEKILGFGTGFCGSARVQRARLRGGWRDHLQVEVLGMPRTGRRRLGDGPGLQGQRVYSKQL